MVALAGRGDREAVPHGRRDLHLADEAPQLGLGLRAGEPVAAAFGALRADLRLTRRPLECHLPYHDSRPSLSART